MLPDYLEDIGLSLHGKGKIIDGWVLLVWEVPIIPLLKHPMSSASRNLPTSWQQGFPRLEKMKDHILVSHTPPFQTKTDKLLNGTHVGSTAVRTFIEQQQPLLCLTGHIHESRGQDYIGRTLILNPGMIKDGGYIEVLFENGEISASLYP